MRRACNAGARLAAPGEFTLRAVAHGKMDLMQAEAVREFIEAQTEEQATNSIATDGGLCLQADSAGQGQACRRHCSSGSRNRFCRRRCRCAGKCIRRRRHPAFARSLAMACGRRLATAEFFRRACASSFSVSRMSENRVCSTAWSVVRSRDRDGHSRHHPGRC